MSGLAEGGDGGTAAAFLRGAGTMLGHERMSAQQFLHGAAECARAFAMDDADRAEAGDERVVQVLLQEIACLVRRASDQV